MILNSKNIYKFYEKIDLKKNMFEKIELFLEDEKKLANILDKKLIIENKFLIGLYLILFLIFLRPEISCKVGIHPYTVGELANKYILISIIILGIISFVQAIVNREKAIKIIRNKEGYKFSFNKFYLKLLKIVIICLYLTSLNFIWAEIITGYSFSDIMKGFGKGSKLLIIANIILIIFLLCYNIYYLIIGGFISSGFNNLGEAIKKGKLDSVKKSISIESESEMILGSTYSIIFKELSVLIDKLEELSDKENKTLLNRTETIANASHDIKTPLTSIKNYICILENKNIKDCDKEKYIDVLKSKILDLQHLISNLKIVSECYEGELSTRFERINIKELIFNILKEYELEFIEKNIEVLEKDFEEEVLNVDVEFNKTIFRNVFSNIGKYSLNNSRVFLEGKKIREDYQDYLKISIKNYSKEELNINPEELFQRFKRGDSSRSTEGNGLGLDIIKNLVKLQNGNVYINIDRDRDQFELVIKYIIY
ncbi:sensor histidine kinase KdpD [uncultured Clostridium sp.]|uniref:sensor histidine kinase n=1 Tax=uncultured Clostridium sp. TaxID=59620 RepID=UPI0025859D7D|nr:sensor histidine kinase [uncultured Clostridium sp.]